MTVPRGALLPPSAAVGLLLCVAVVVLAPGCVTTPTSPPGPPVIFPPPPAQARVQFLGSVSSSADLPRRRGGFAEFILGPEPIRFPLRKPINTALFGSRLYICDTVLNTVLVYDLETGDTHPLAGDRAAGKIQQPNNLAVDETGRIYVADKLRRAVLVYDPDESFVTARGRIGKVTPVAVAVGNDVLYVCDITDNEIEVWNRADGTYLRSIGGQGNEPGKFEMPTYVALDGEGNLYVTDTANFRVQKLSPTGQVLGVVGGYGTEFGRFLWPKGLDLDGLGRLYVADSRFANVQIFNREGKLLLFFGGPGPDQGNLGLPAGLKVYPWPSIPWLRERVLAGFDPEFLVIVVNQETGGPYINFFAVARETEESQ